MKVHTPTIGEPKWKWIKIKIPLNKKAIRKGFKKLIEKIK